MYALFRHVYSSLFFLLGSDTTGHVKPSKVSRAVLPVEFQFLKIVRNIGNKRHTWREDVAASDWSGFSVQRENNTLEKIVWTGWRLEGNVSWSDIPTTVTQIHAGSCALTGVVPFHLLPSNLQGLSISQNNLEGELFTKYLPSSLEVLNLGKNLFSGELDLSMLPQALRFVYLDRNRFRDTIQLDGLPSGLLTLNVSFNELSGRLHLRNLPPRLISMELMENFFLSCGPDPIPREVVFHPQKKASAKKNIGHGR